jgi:DNA-binding response OmpR family regulator
VQIHLCLSKETSVAKVLVIEDNPETQALLMRALSPAYEVKIAPDLQSAWKAIENDEWETIILDRSLPDGDGLEICLKLRKMNMESRSSILILTAHSELEEKIRGFSAGADDYIVKPFEPRELLARMEAIQRRRTDGGIQSTISLANLLINIETHAVSVKLADGESTSIDLTPIEFKILFALVKNYGKEIDRQTLVRLIWDKVNLSERNIDTHVCHLRKKIAQSRLSIKNKRGNGYYIKTEEAPASDAAETAHLTATLPHPERSISGTFYSNSAAANASASASAI